MNMSPEKGPFQKGMSSEPTIDVQRRCEIFRRQFLFERGISIAMLDSGSVGDWQSSFPTKTFMIELTQSFGWSKNSIVYTIVRGWLHHFKVHPDGLWRSHKSHNNLNHKNGFDLLAIYVTRIFTPKKTWCPSRIFILMFFQALL